MPEDVGAGRLTFIGQTHALGRTPGGPLDWRAADALPLLWRFNLHYFQFLEAVPSKDERVALCRAWVAAHPPRTPVAWHPYPTSLRVVNWVKAGVAEAAPDLAASLYLQAASLARTLETYVRGNHLVENARALVVAGRALAGQGEADRWTATGLRILRRLTPEVVLPDGGFYERSPMYHALMLEAWLDVVNALPQDHPDVPALAATARRMADALASMVHPGGRPVLFNDATEEIAPPAHDLFDYAHRLLGHTPAPARPLPDTGLFVHAGERLFVAIDGGMMAPDELPAHGHADTFTYEVTAGTTPIVVDSGVYEYAATERRQFGRSTAAHSTVQVDGVDHAEVYGSFRVGRRAHPHGVAFESDGGRSRFAGHFDGYARLLGDDVRVHRRMEVDDAAGSLTVLDRVTGQGAHRVETRVHLSPGVAVTLDGPRATLAAGAVRLVALADGADWAVETQPQSPRFGVEIDRPVLVLRRDGALPATLAYTLRLAD